MIQLFSAILTLSAVLIYFKLKKNANKKYGDSITFQIIDREYNKWYKKRGNGAVINKNTTSMFEVDKVIWFLRKSMGEQGISKEQLTDYLAFLESDLPKEYDLKGIIFTLLSYFGIQNMLNNLFGNVITKDKGFDFNVLNDKLSQATNFYFKNTEQIQIGIVLFSLILVIYLLIRVMYSIINMDNIHKNSQRIFVLKRVKEIWEFGENNEIKTIQEAIKNSEVTNNQIYIKLPSSQSTFDEEMNKAIGNSFHSNFQFIAKNKIISLIDLSSIKEWILGEIIPSLFNFLSVFLSYFIYVVFFKQKHYTLLFLFIPALAMVISVYFIFYFSQLDKLEGYNQELKVKKEDEEEFTYKLEKREIKNVRTKIAIFLQITITLAVTISFLIFNKVPLGFSFILILIPIILLLLITVFGGFKKVTKSKQT